MARRLHGLILLLAALAAALGTSPTRAAESQAVVTPRATATLVGDLAAVTPGAALRLALHLRLDPGWHVYWANPGDAGAPPEITLTAPAGAATAPLRFAAPRRIPFGPLVNFGHETEAVFVLPVTLPAGLPPGDTLTLAAEATWLICRDICVPETAAFTLDLPVAAAARPAPRALFDTFEAAEPQPSPFTTRVGFAGRAGALLVEGVGLDRGAVRDAFFFPASAGVLDHAAPQRLTLEPGRLRLALTRGAAPLPDRLEGVLTLTDAAGVRGAWTIAAAPGPLPTDTAPGLWATLALAAFGGLLLNLMPCVFPVLAMKAMALARLSGEARGEVRVHALAYTAGVLALFLLLGGGLVALRGLGAAVGWGFQFTQPTFVAAMAWLMLAVGLNLSGVFAVGGPVGAGQAAVARGGRLGAFATGALAVLVATPCTAPFMATAIGAGLVLPAPAAVAVFAAMALGMAAPTLLLALVPGLTARLPRPGPWMAWLRGALAFPMYGAAAWLLWVLAVQGGADAVFLGLGGAVLVGFAGWTVGVAQRAGPRGRRVGIAAAALAGMGALAMLPGPSLAPPVAPRAAVAGAEPWSAARLEELRRADRPVLVNFTAAWCLTCKVNEQMALGATAVREAFARADAAVLVGDWTRGDPAITAALRAEARDGVPLYLLYPRGGGPPTVLPQILTEGILLRALAAG